MERRESSYGICGSCEHQRLIRTGRGSEFSLCSLSVDDPDWPRYPRMPVLRCSRWEERTGSEPRVGHR